MKTKALVSMLLAIAMLCSLLVGCKSSDDPNSGGQTQAALDVETKLTDTKLEGEKDDTKHTITTLLTFTPEPAGHGHPMVEGGPDWSIQPLIYESLCDYSSQSDNNFSPQFLESFEVDGKVLTLKLKEGLKYSDGSEINADELLSDMYLDMSLP